jgi:hypothetical protein
MDCGGESNPIKEPVGEGNWGLFPPLLRPSWRIISLEYGIGYKNESISSKLGNRQEIGTISTKLYNSIKRYLRTRGRIYGGK